MRWFRRTRRVNVGTYTDPVPTPPPNVEAQIEDGVLVALSAARLAVTNRLILRSMRDGKDYDEKQVRLAVTDEILALAAEKEGDATRVRALRHDTRERPGAAVSADDFRARDAKVLERRATVDSGLATRLGEIATDPVVVGDIAARARSAFLDEFGVSVARGARAFAPPRGKPLTEMDRNAELQRLAEDLESLGAGRASADSPLLRRATED